MLFLRDHNGRARGRMATRPPDINAESDRVCLRYHFNCIPSRIMRPCNTLEGCRYAVVAKFVER